MWRAVMEGAELTLACQWCGETAERQFPKNLDRLVDNVRSGLGQTEQMILCLPCAEVRKQCNENDDTWTALQRTISCSVCRGAMRASEFSASQRREGEQKRKCPSCAALSAEKRERLHSTRSASLGAAGQDFVGFGAAWCFAIWG